MFHLFTLQRLRLLALLVGLLGLWACKENNVEKLVQVSSQLKIGMTVAVGVEQELVRANIIKPDEAQVIGPALDLAATAINHFHARVLQVEQFGDLNKPTKAELAALLSETGKNLADLENKLSVIKDPKARERVQFALAVIRLGLNLTSGFLSV